jgi:hypothetical protein
MGDADPTTMVVPPNTPMWVQGGVVAEHDGDTAATVRVRGVQLTFGHTSGSWTVYPADPTFFATVVERHIRSDVDRENGVRDVPLGQANGAHRPSLACYLEHTLARVEARPAEMYEIHFYRQGLGRYNVDPILCGHFRGHELRAALAATGWQFDKDGDS